MTERYKESNSKSFEKAEGMGMELRIQFIPKNKKA